MHALLKDGAVVVAELMVARRFHERLFGLMGRARLGRGRALLLHPCGSIHTCFMRFPLDVLFLDADNQVVRRVDHVRPWRVALGGARAVSVVEMEAGWLPPDAVKAGDRLISSLR